MARGIHPSGGDLGPPHPFAGLVDSMADLRGEGRAASLACPPRATLDRRIPDRGQSRQRRRPRDDGSGDARDLRDLHLSRGGAARPPRLPPGVPASRATGEE